MSRDDRPTSTLGGRPLEDSPLVSMSRTDDADDHTDLTAGRAEGQRDLTLGHAEEQPVLSVVIPAYNEAESIIGAITTILQTVERVCDSYEVIVVDDGSDDGTVTKLNALSETLPPVTVLCNDQNRGKGYAIRDGCLAADGEYVMLMDADGDLTADRITTFLDRIRETDADIVVGSKRHPDSDVEYPLRRRVLSRGYLSLVRLLFGLRVTDTQVGMKLLSDEAVDDVMPLLLVERYAFDAELLALANQHDYDIAEAPVSIDFGGDSSVDWREIYRIARDTLAVFCRLKLLGTYRKLERAVEYATEYGDADDGTNDGGVD